MAATPTCQYTCAYIVSLNDPTSRIKRTTRKLLFYYGLWNPEYARQETFSKLHRQEKFSEQGHPSPAEQSDPSPAVQSDPSPSSQPPCRYVDSSTCWISPNWSIMAWNAAVVGSVWSSRCMFRSPAMTICELKRANCSNTTANSSKKAVVGWTEPGR